MAKDYPEKKSKNWGNFSIYSSGDDNGVRMVNFVISKDLTVKSTM
jgi:hypothetical protein